MYAFRQWHPQWFYHIHLWTNQSQNLRTNTYEEIGGNSSSSLSSTLTASARLLCVKSANCELSRNNTLHHHQPISTHPPRKNKTKKTTNRKNKISTYLLFRLTSRTFAFSDLVMLRLLEYKYANLALHHKNNKLGPAFNKCHQHIDNWIDQKYTYLGVSTTTVGDGGRFPISGPPGEPLHVRPNKI
jgi:hypothetical protein